MPNPVVHFEVRGNDPARLRRFYAEAFGWDVEPIGGEYALVSPARHVHDEAGATIYSGDDAHMNDGVQLGSAWGQPAWRYPGEPQWRPFEPGISGGIGSGGTGVSVSIQVPDLEAALGRIIELGGSVVREPEEVAPSVVVASFADPEGNVLGLIRG